MILIIENDSEKRNAVRYDFFSKFAINTCGADTETAEAAFDRFRIEAAYIPNTVSLKDPVGFCRAFKRAHPEIPLVAAVPKNCELPYLDELYAVTDNIPLLPLASVRIAEIICELIRMYTGKDRLELGVAGVTLNIYCASIFYGTAVLPLGVHTISILRYLFSQSPRPVPQEELCAATGSPYRERSYANLRVRIHTINRRTADFIGRPLIAHEPGKGYYIALLRPKK